MATPIIMPRQGQSVESCLIGKWYKNKGDKVSVGDILFTYETDKATFEEESKVDGILLDIFFEEGDDVECLVNVCVIGAEGESAEEFKPKVSEIKPAASTPSEVTTGISVSTEKPVNVIEYNYSPDNQKISPRARRLAEKTNADLRYAIPTGANERIIEADVQAVLSKGHRCQIEQGDGSSVLLGSYEKSITNDKQIEQMNRPPVLFDNNVEIIPLSNVRKFIAKAMHASLTNSAQLTSHSSFDATDVIAYRESLKALPGAGGKTGITITDIIVYAVSRVLLKHKYINSHFLGDKIARFNNAHIGIAVDTPRGLLVPTVFNAETMSLTELSAHCKVLFEKCKTGSVEPDLLKGASFTISNLGGLGVEMFTPILNPPQTGILGVCNVIERTKNGKPYPALGLSVTYDHQAMDGADSARFLKDMVEYLENFSSNLEVS